MTINPILDVMQAHYAAISAIVSPIVADLDAALAQVAALTAENGQLKAAASPTFAEAQIKVLQAENDRLRAGK